MAGEIEILPPISTAVWSGEFTLMGVTLHCHVLNTGERVIDADDVHAFLDAMGGGGDMDESALMEFARFMRGRGTP